MVKPTRQMSSPSCSCPVKQRGNVYVGRCSDVANERAVFIDSMCGPLRFNSSICDTQDGIQLVLQDLMPTRTYFLSILICRESVKTVNLPPIRLYQSGSSKSRFSLTTKCVFYTSFCLYSGPRALGGGSKRRTAFPISKPLQNQQAIIQYRSMTLSTGDTSTPTTFISLDSRNEYYRLSTAGIHHGKQSFALQ